jgi:Immunity protein 26
MKGKDILYSEGQWFAVPLRTGGYALGIITRGNYKTKGGLGYFFGPKYSELPGDEATWQKSPEDAVLITQFGDLGLINGTWPLIPSTRLFSKEDWPMPKFGMEVSLIPGKAFLREYGQKHNGKLMLIRETVVDIRDIADLPEDVSMGGGAVEIKLTNLLDP